MKRLIAPLSILQLLHSSVRAQAADPDLIDISKALGWVNTRLCLQGCFITVYPANAYGTYAGCGTNTCWCRPDNLYAGSESAYQCALTACSNLNDAAQVSRDSL